MSTVPQQLPGLAMAALLLLLPATVAQPLSFTQVIAADDTLRACYRNPVLTRTARGTLLCFIEERKSARNRKSFFCDSFSAMFSVAAWQRSGSASGRAA
eukprot:COSAG04_NODE_2537_length_3962_cov_10.154025_2_plen_99_part_00